MNKKIVLGINIHDEKVKRKAMEAVSTLLGIDFIGVDMDEQKMTVIGYVDSFEVALKLNECCSNQILSVETLTGDQPEKEDLDNETVEDENWVVTNFETGIYMVILCLCGFLEIYTIFASKTSYL